jgi:hypothetical protein
MRGRMGVKRDDPRRSIVLHRFAKNALAQRRRAVR